MTSPSFDLAVVGGGPVGVTTALLAARRGLSALVLERETEVYALPRAVGMDDEIQRVLSGAGLGAELEAITTPLPGAEFVRPGGGQISGVEMPVDVDWPLGHHPLVLYHQPDLERLLRGAAVASGVDLRLGTAVTGVGQSGDGAWVDVGESGESTGRIHARWVVAADGASSPTRKSLDISFDDAGFDQEWLVVDAELRDPAHRAGLPTLAQQICDPLRPTTFVPGHGPYCRWEFQLQDGETSDEMIEPDRVWELVGPWLTPNQASLGRAVVYRFHATVAARMRAGNVFLAGDAAHQMPPFLGQGLCSGMRDAANLTWKLASVLRGEAGDRLLDSYDLERRPHARGMVDYAVDVGRTIDRLSGREPVDGDVDLDAAYSGERPFPHLAAGVRAGDHAMTGRQLPQPMCHGHPLDEVLGDGFALLVGADGALPPEVAEAWAALGARTVVADDGRVRDLIPAAGLAIVRPDRYVAAVAADATEAVAASNEVLGWFSGRSTCR